MENIDIFHTNRPVDLLALRTNVLRRSYSLLHVILLQSGNRDEHSHWSANETGNKSFGFWVNHHIFRTQPNANMHEEHSSSGQLGSWIVFVLFSGRVDYGCFDFLWVFFSFRTFSQQNARFQTDSKHTHIFSMFPTCKRQTFRFSLSNRGLLALRRIAVSFFRPTIATSLFLVEISFARSFYLCFSSIEQTVDLFPRPTASVIIKLIHIRSN